MMPLRRSETVDIRGEAAAGQISKKCLKSDEHEKSHVLNA